MNGAAAKDGRLQKGDKILEVSILFLSSLMGYGSIDTPGGVEEYL